MTGYEFYSEKLNEHGDTVLAVFGPDCMIGGTAHRECIASIFNEPNGECAVAAASVGYLVEDCKPVSEEEARKIHPRLFEYLESRTDDL
jgi:hypothetical protein